MTDASHLASEALAAEVKKKVRERALVVWVDAEGQYSELVDALATGAFGFTYPVAACRGSYLELMLALEAYGNDLDPEHLLVHLPGLNKDTVKETPIFELFAAGTTFEKNLGTLVREAAVGIAKPSELDAFVRAVGLTLAKADAWLEERSVEPRDGLSLLMDSLGLDDVVMALLAADRRFEAHLPHDGDKLLAFLEKGLGLNAAWRQFRIGAAELRMEAMTSLVASWLMAVEFVHDLKEPPVTPALRQITSLGPFAKVSRKLATRFRDQLPDVYEELANDLQMLLEQERTSHHADALGTIDTFRFEESTTRAAALEALRGGDWSAAHAFAVERTPEQSFWVKRSKELQRTWELIRRAASAGKSFETHAKGLGRCASLDEATQRYAEKLAEVDRKHRELEQRAHALIASDLEDHEALLEARSAVRRAYRIWTNGVNRAFFDLCVARGPLPSRQFRQRAIYEDVVQPLIESRARVAFFMVDALRFEMAQSFAEDLKREKFLVHLSARLAELPTETAIGMNVLAPVEENGRLHALVKNGNITGFRFKAKEFAVCDPAARLRAISDRSLSASRAADILLEAFQDMSLTQLKRALAGKTLVVVRSRELDTAGENNLHLGTFNQTLALLKSAISLLAQAGMEKFVVCSDHGFLLQDSTVENVQFGATKRLPERRYALLTEPSGKADVLEVRLSALEYEAAQDLYLVLAPDTALWKKYEDIAAFVHGGNSLQERVVPVLEIERTVARGKTTSKYEVVANPEPSHLGRQRLKLSVRLQDRETATLAFLAPQSVSLSLRVVGRPNLAITLLDAGPPATLTSGRIMVPPNRTEALIEFELEGEIDEKVRVEIFHPDAVEDVAPKIVDGFFDVGRNRRLGKVSAPPPVIEAAPAPVASPEATADTDWERLVADPAYLRVFKIIEAQRSINEAELQQVLGTPTRVRAFARNYEAIVRLLPFGVEVLTVNGMKAYARKD